MIVIENIMKRIMLILINLVMKHMGNHQEAQQEENKGEINYLPMLQIELYIMQLFVIVVELYIVQKGL